MQMQRVMQRMMRMQRVTQMQMQESDDAISLIVRWCIHMHTPKLAWVNAQWLAEYAGMQLQASSC